MIRIEELSYKELKKVSDGSYIIRINFANSFYRAENSSKANNGKGYILSSEPINEEFPLDNLVPVFIKNLDISDPLNDQNYAVLGTVLSEMDQKISKESDIIVPIKAIKSLDLIA